MDWTEGLERALLVGLLTGRLGLRRGALPVDVFSGVRRRLVLSAEEYHEKYGKWPQATGLYDLCRKYPTAELADARREIRSVQQVTGDQVAYALDQVRPVIKRRALKLAAIEIDALAEAGPESFAASRAVLETALSAGEAEGTPFSYAVGLLDRHRPDAVARAGGIICPTGLPTIDTAMGGGLKSGEVGFIMAPTKRGKSHWAVMFGAEWLRQGGHVLHLSLELRDQVVAQRYDRALTGMDDWEIHGDPAKFERAWTETLPNPQRLDIRAFPRFSLGVTGVQAIVERKLQEVGKPVLVVLDYGQILRPEAEGAPHLQIGRTHEALSAMAMALKVPLWSPYQTNRVALGKDAKGRVGLDHAGGSYESLQHADVVLTLSQDEEQAINRKMRVALEACRDTKTAFVDVRYDWARTRATECPAS